MRRIGIVTAGGDAPGMNAAIRSVVRTAIHEGLEVIGFERGYAGIISGETRIMGPRSVSGIINLGGTILKSQRCEEIKTSHGLEKASKTLKRFDIDGLIAIGGEGTFKGASQIHNVSNIPVIGIPATIDNDVAGTDTTIGFDTAVNTALSAIDKIRDTATSHDRIFIIEVMGRERGFLAIEVGLAGGAEEILVPEIEFNIAEICKRVEQAREKEKTSEIIVIAEGAGDSRKIVKYLSENTGYEVRLTVLGHVQRGGRPSLRSRILACQFGNKAIKLLIQGFRKRMVGIRYGKIVSVDLDYAWKTRKELDTSLYELAKILST